MRTIPLYEDMPEAAVELVEPMEHDEDCERCALHGRRGLRTCCMPAEGEPGGLLVVGEAPGSQEDAAGRPFVGPSGGVLRKVLAKRWSGPVAIANALGCYPGGRKVTPKMVAACRPYLANVLAEVQPERVVLLGKNAALSVLGRSIPPFSSRGACAHLGDGAPVFTVVHPAAGLRNRFVMRWFAEDFRRALVDEPEPPPVRGLVRVVESLADARAQLEGLRLDRRSIMFDVETAGTLHGDDLRLLCLSFCKVGSDSPLLFGYEVLGDPGVQVELRKFLESRDVDLGGQNVKFDQLVVRQALGARIAAAMTDTRLQRKLLEPEAGASLDAMAELVGMGGMKDETEELLHKLARGARKVVNAYNRGCDDLRLKQATLDKRRAAYEALDPFVRQCVERGYEDATFGYYMLPHDVLYRYNGRDSVCTARLKARYDGELVREPELRATWVRTVKPASMAIADIERWGIAVSRGSVEALDAYLANEERDALARLGRYGEPNWNAPGQVAELLYGKLGLECIKSTKGGAESTDKEALEALRGKHPVVDDLLRYRSVTKLRGTYAAGLLRAIRPDGRVHCNYKLDGTRSGRPSATDPNLLNIPRAKDSPEGKMIRDSFVASPGMVLVELDESQVELRVAAALSGDPLMRKLFADGEDYHLRTAQLIARDVWGIEPGQVEEKHRSQAKTVNFQSVYRGGPRALAKKLGISIAKAERIQEAIMGNFGRFEDYCDECLRYVQEHGYTWTWWDGQRARRRPMWRIADSDDKTRSVAENGSVNTPIQGTASDVTMNSIVVLHDWILSDGIEDLVKMVLTVYDSILFECALDMVDEVVATGRGVMESWPLEGVPLVADAKVGHSWGSMVDYEEWKEVA